MSSAAWLINPFVIIALVLPFALLTGFLTSLLALISPVRTWARSGWKARATLGALLALAAFLLVMALSTRAFAWLTFNAYTVYVDDLDTYLLSNTEATGIGRAVTRRAAREIVTSWRRNERAILNEIWLRTLFPPAREYPCYTGQQALCAIMDRVGIFYTSVWRSYLFFVGIGLLAAIAAGFGVRFFTRHPRAGKEVS